MRAGPVLFSVLFAALMTLAACDTVQDRVAKHQARGLELAEAGDFPKAQLEFRNAIKLDPAFVPGWLELAKLLERQRKFGDAYSHFLKVIELDPKHVEALSHNAQIALLAGQLDKALEFANRAQAEAPGDADVLAVKSAVSLRVGNTAAAVAEANEALKLNPAQAGAAIVLITERREAGARAEALAMADTYLAAHPEDLALGVAKLQLLGEMGDGDATGAHLRTLTETFPEVGSFRSALAEWLLAKGDIDAAVTEYRAVARLSPENPEAALDVARFLIRARGIDAGRAELDALIAANPAVFDYKAALAALDYTNGRKDAARALLQGVIDGNASPDATNAARVHLARLLVNERDMTGARALVEAVLTGDARNAEALGLRAAILIEQGELDPAILDIRSALGESPDDVKLLQLAATAFGLNGSIELASESLGKAARVSNYDPTISLRYADFLVKHDQTGAAETVLSEAARRNATNRDLLAALAELRLRLKDWTGAEQAAQVLREQAGDAATADRVLAAALTGQERFTESIGLLQGMSTDDAGARDANMAALVSVYVRAGQQDQAKAFLTSVLADNPGNLQALLLRAALHKYQGEMAEAGVIYRDVVARAPEAPGAYSSLAEFHFQNGDPAEGEAVIRRGLDAVPGAAGLRFALAQVLEQRGDFAGAIAEYRVLFERSPDSLVVANNLASLLGDHQAQDPDALALATRVAQRLRASAVPQFQDTYGWTMYLAGDYDQALGSLITAAEALPDNAWVQYHVGMAYAKVAQPDRARTHLERALALAGQGQVFPKADDARAVLASLPPATVQQ